MIPKLLFLGSFYDHPNRDMGNRDNVYDPRGIAPCLMASMGGGGGLVPCIILIPSINKGMQKSLSAQKKRDNA